MKWTTEKPTQNGYYWLKWPDGDCKPVEINGCSVFTFGTDFEVMVGDLTPGVRWCGPIVAQSDDESASPVLTDRQLTALAEFIFHELGSPSDWCGFDFDGARRAIADVSADESVTLTSRQIDRILDIWERYPGLEFADQLRSLGA
ncbi:hypothetical protein [Burkholderia stabilis]|jgi:hypothetical protein